MRSKQIVIHEVGLRDGLQMEKQIVPFDRKVQWIQDLIEARVDIIQLGSFVHPEKVPQMADTDRLFQYFNEADRKPTGTVFSGLVLNEKGLERASACGVDLICMGVSASETHSRKNTGMGTAEAAQRIIAMAKEVLTQGKDVQVSVQSAFGCGFEGEVPAEQVLGLVQRYCGAGIKHISLADTAGHAQPYQVSQMLEDILRLDAGIECTCHFHNTYGLGMANCIAAIEAGAECLESSVAGLGGCPFTKVAAGNVCTEDLVHFLQRIGHRPEIDLGKLISLAKDVSSFLGRELPGLVYKTGPVRSLAQIPGS